MIVANSPVAAMYQIVKDAMSAIGETGLVFGSENPQKGESEFQSALGNALAQLTSSDDWAWRYSGSPAKEKRFKTDTLSNEETIAIDVFGEHRAGGMVAIELKYVPAPPMDKYAFPWDVAKDCLKLDLLRAGYCKPIPMANLQTYVIAMTDWPSYWNGAGSFGWSSNFVNVMRVTPVRFEKIIETTASNPDNAIFKQKRCHIALGRSWTGEWEQFGSVTLQNQFRYLLLRPEPDNQPQWVHHKEKSVHDQSRIIPFLNAESRAAWTASRMTM